MAKQAAMCALTSIQFKWKVIRFDTVGRGRNKNTEWRMFDERVERFKIGLLEVFG